LFEEWSEVVVGVVVSAEVPEGVEPQEEAEVVVEELHVVVVLRVEEVVAVLGEEQKLLSFLTNMLVFSSDVERKMSC